MVNQPDAEKRRKFRGAAEVGSGVVRGTIGDIGHQVDDDEGKVVGGLVGAGVGSAIAVKTRGQEIVFPAGATLTVTLRSPTTVELPG